MTKGGSEGEGALTAQTGIASNAGIVVQAGGNVTFVHPGSSQPATGPVYASRAPRSTRPMYLRQVGRIAAPQLLDRGGELSELADFCLRDDGVPYVWWQAGPWAGKSALLAAFVSNPPESLVGRVWLVSFFVTARLAAQDTSNAFTTAVTTQLCELLGEEPAIGVDEAVRELVMLDLLVRAAATCRAAGGRLVLVVDGLDEDRGVTTGPGAHSIAALLPGRPEHGMRVVVAGRPNPPIPDDVPDWHPLRDPAIVRPLSGSPYARDRQRLGQSELKRLLRGGLVEQNVLGLLTASRGGLSREDLCVLTDAGAVEVEDVLHTVVGRTFTRRPGAWSGATGPEVYLLGHEELHTAACDYLGPDRLAGYRARLFAWADGHRVPGASRPAWPPATPEYLLTGYPRMLATIRAVDRLVALATDRVRHDRMLELSGGDAAALVEITECQDLLLATPQTDLRALARLSVHRYELQTRNSNIPTELPALWATLGHTARAEALARSVTDPRRQELSLELLADGVAASGDFKHAEQIARTLQDPSPRARALARVAARLDRAGVRRQAHRMAIEADDLVRTIPHWHEHTTTMIVLAETLASLDDHERAVRLARAINDEHERARVLTTLACASAVAGDRRTAHRLAADAEQVADRTTDEHLRANLLAGLVRAVILAGDHERARDLVGGVERIAFGIEDPHERAWALVGLVEALTAVGERDRALSVARGISRPPDGVRALRGLARATVSRELRPLAVEAESLARTILDPNDRARALTVLAQDAVAALDHDSARRLATEAERIARTTTNRHRHSRTLTGLASALAAVGDHERATRVAHRIPDPTDRAHALLDLARSAAGSGDDDLARRLIDDAELLTPAFTDEHDRSRHLADLVETTAAAGHYDRAGLIAQRIAYPLQRTETLTALASTIAMAGDHSRAARIARRIPHPNDRSRALVEVAGALVEAGDLHRARNLAADAAAIADEDSDVVHRALTLAQLLDALTVAGRKRAHRLSAAVVGIVEHGMTPSRATTLAGLIEMLATAGDELRARQLAAEVMKHVRSIPHTSSLEVLATALAAVGAHEDLAKVVDRLAELNSSRTSVWTGIVEALISADKPGVAAQVVLLMPSESRRTATLTRLAETLADRGDRDQARRMAMEAAHVIQRMVHSDARATATVGVAANLAAAGDYEQAGRLALEAAHLAHGMNDPDERTSVLTRAAATLAAGGGHEHARHLAVQATHAAEGMDDLDKRVSALTRVANTFVKAGDREHAHRLAGEVARIIHRSARPDRKAAALASVAVVADSYGDAQFLGQALATGEWPTILPVLMELNPPLLVEIFDELERADADRGAAITEVAARVE